MSIMTRSAALFWGWSVPDDVACYVKGPRLAERGWRTVTWDEVLHNRRQRQAEHLRHIRQIESSLWYLLRVKYYDMFLMGGWAAELLRYQNYTWIDRDARGLKNQLMEAFPLLLPGISDWTMWQQAFARTYCRGTFDGQPVGYHLIRLDKYFNLEAIHKEKTGCPRHEKKTEC